MLFVSGALLQSASVLVSEKIFVSGWSARECALVSSGLGLEYERI